VAHPSVEVVLDKLKIHIDKNNNIKKGKVIFIRKITKVDK
jgi:hypothetical protein